MLQKTFKNTLFTGDNLFILNGMNSESVDLIYLDPPFNSKRFYSAPIGSKSAGASFKDMWTWNDVNEFYLEKIVNDYPYLVEYIESIEELHSKSMMAYVTYMTQRIIEIHRILKQTGSLYIHLDPTASHYIKLVLDRIFGRKNFRNEIVWCYPNGGKSKNLFAKKHDTILFYSKSTDFTFNGNDIRIPYELISKKSISPFNLTDKDGRRYRERISNNKVYTYYEDVGKIPNDWWIDIQPLTGRHGREERTGYPTQKPLSLLHRIVKVSSNEGDIVLDPFCGCATTCVASQQLGRQWIGIDIEEKATEVLIDRLKDDAGLFSDFVHRSDIPIRTDIKSEPITQNIKERLFNEQKGECNACKSKMDIWHFEVDHKIPKSIGGGDYYENYQLLCANCNRIKGNRPMEYLNMKIQQRKDQLSKITFGK